jgi:two-component system chemotaxis sensor kinase CheA
MSDDLLDIFKEEATGYIKGLNEGLLKLELTEGEEKESLLTEMNRMAHSMKGAARSVGFGMIETISHYLEEIFYAALNWEKELTPAMVDLLYDGIDLIQNTLNSEETKEEIIVEVLHNLEKIVTSARLLDNPNGLRTESAEIAAIKETTIEITAITEETPKAGKRGSSELLNIFWVELTEHLAALNDGLLKVEMTRGNERTELLREMNRVAHSMKGAARSVGFETIETISHYIEAVLEGAIDGDMNLTPNVADLLYDGLDLIQETVNGQPSMGEIVTDVLTQLETIIKGSERGNRFRPLKGHDPVPPAEQTPEIEIPPALMTSTLESVGASPTMVLRPPEESIRVTVNKLDQLMADASELLLAKLQSENRYRLLRELRQDHARWQREWRSARAAYIRLSRKMQEEPDAFTPEMSAIFHFLENNEDHLGHANRTLGQLGQMFTQDNIQISSLADQLQNNVSRLRMMPFETIIGGFQRMARDLARDLSKQLHLEIVGAGVEIDKTVLDALKDPLMHLLRNAIDHGIELPHRRELRGKLPAGNVHLIVEQRGSEIAIQVRDDGRGLDVEKLREKAIERNIVSSQEANSMSVEEIQLLVFHSGLTTSDTVTSLSGRGLGMDIVRTRVESLRGRIHIQSVPGEGTALTINVPVSLTRLRVTTLRVGDEVFAIPSVMIERMETVPINAVFTAEGQEMLNINDRPMTLVSLGTILEAPTIDEREDKIQIIALQAGDRSVAFEVDELYNEIELVLKPLGRELVNAPFVAGAALLGSGEVIIVLDANDLVRSATGTSLKARQRPIVRSKAREQRPLRVLIVDDSITTRTLEKNILESVGFEVHVAIDGSEAWQRIPEIEPDVIVSDVEMPKINGVELTKLIKATPQTRDLPVILLTSLNKPHQREAGLEAGADAYLVKSSFDQRELLETIRSVL